MGDAIPESALVRERKALADVLHDEVLQGVIAARWAVDGIEPAHLPAGEARALAEAIQALDQAQEAVRDQITRLRAPDEPA